MPNLRFRRFLVLPLLLLLPAAYARQQASNTEKSVFWEVSGKGLRKPSYLFGTHHLFSSTDLADSAAVLARIQKADAVMIEVILDSAALVQIGMASLRNDPRPLDKIMTPEDYRATDKVLQELTGYSLNMGFDRLKPAALYTFLLMQRYAKDLKIDPTAPNFLPLDKYFEQQGHRFNKPVLPLETVEDQINVLYNLYSEERALELLKEVVENKNGESMAEMAELNNLYRRQNLTGMNVAANKSMQSGERQALLTNRNNKWMEQLRERLPRQSLFVAVGALHLAGDDGLLAQLRKAGYTVKPLPLHFAAAPVTR